ncbi:hypothetical protein TRFO_25207 [Tritrichomonas foetus]|uniref:Uncharacterized protein n=1 Tax=Tritrichomonas foetus TaxID=1144522 RepID=A0A1J4K6S6_9EUKA|nr:hypothetical protein TRFO_25207 [Tritrichomonas foetus]|eukprot:OHT06674.1 hypothetical protein TRFO_25207 [Tritrichomonas foetus]
MNLFITSTIICSFISLCTTSGAFFTEALYLENQKLGGYGTSLDSFLRYSIVALMISFFFQTLFSLIHKAWARGIAIVIALEIFIHNILSLIFLITSKKRTMKMFSMLFIPGEMSGDIIMKKHNCCGWDNSTQYLGLCTSNITCNEVISNLFPGKKSIIVPLLSISIVLDFYDFVVLIYSMKFISPHLPSFKRGYSSIR